MGTLTRADLTESVYRNIGLSRNESSDLVEAVLEEICVCLVAGEEVKLSSFWGRSGGIVGGTVWGKRWSGMPPNPPGNIQKRKIALDLLIG